MRLDSPAVHLGRARPTRPRAEIILPSLAGQELDKYEVLEEVGHGGMAVVYRGRDRVLDREVAVKVLHPHLASREESRLRLRREAITVAKLRHENIVEIYDYSGPDAEESYIVTEFIHGQTLREWLDEQWRPHPVVAAMVMYRLCLALEHAHLIGVVHRDIKPENVMIRRDGCLKLMDFGIAQILDQQKLTMTGQLLGSPAYMAPELICGKPVDKRTDLFASGVLLYQLATGQLPFSGRNPHEVLHKISDAQYKPATEVNPKVDDGLSDLIDHALAQEPVNRFQSALSMSNDLEDYLGRFDITPEDVDLAAYFKNPALYIDELDQRLSATLLQKARAETKNGNRTKALGLLGQVMEFDPQNKEAASLVGEVKARGRRLRAVAFLASGVAVGGLVVAGIMLARASGPAVAQIDDTSGDVGPMPKRRMGIPMNPQGGKVNGPGLGAKGAEAGGIEVATGGAVETGDPPPTKKATKSTKSGGFAIRPSGHGSTVDCKVQVTGLNKRELSGGSYQVHADRMKRPVDKSTGTLVIPISAKRPVTAKLDGPNKGGFVVLDTEACARGPLVLGAKALDARVSWTVDPASSVRQPLDDITLTCKRNCWKGAAHQKASRSFVMPAPGPDSTSWTVEFEVKTTGLQDGFTLTKRVHAQKEPQTYSLLLDDPVH